MLIAKFISCDMKEKIKDIENKYEIILPVQYKCFLEKYNGGYTPKTKFKNGRTSSDLRGFYGIGNVKLSLNDSEIQEWLENKMFPMACDSFGNHIVIGLNNDDLGKIFFCDHEKGDNSVVIADNLKEFLNACKSEKISETSKKTIKEREETLISKGKGNIITDDLRKLWQAEIDKYKDMIQEEVSID